MLILVADAFDSNLPKRLEAFGEVTTDSSRVADADVVMIRSKTTCDKAYIDKAPKLKLIIRGGVGIDNIDKVYAESKGTARRRAAGGLRHGRRAGEGGGGPAGRAGRGQ